MFSINQILTTGFNDIIDDSFLSGGTGQLDIKKALVSLGIAIVVGLLISIIYKLTFSGVVYSSTFNTSLLLMTVITAVIIITISSNVVLSLGMVGALSIVRFRAAIKDPIDIMYLFWAISVGIVIGAQQYIFAIIASAIIALICIIAYRFRSGAQAYLLVVRYDPAISEQLERYIAKAGAKVRSKTASAAYVEVIADISERKIPDGFIEKLSASRGVKSAVLVKYNGEYCE